MAGIEHDDIACGSVRAVESGRDRQRNDRQEKERIEVDDRPGRERLVRQRALMTEPEHRRDDKAEQKRDDLRMVGGP